MHRLRRDAFPDPLLQDQAIGQEAAEVVAADVLSLLGDRDPQATFQSLDSPLILGHRNQLL